MCTIYHKVGYESVYSINVTSLDLAMPYGSEA
jgi:hypothetical protein